MEPRLLARLFGFRERVTRRFYIQAGVTLMVAKYVVDAAVIWLTSRQPWAPWDYLLPLLTIRGDKLDQLPEAVGIGLVLWTLPFLWIGVSTTLRRAVDAGLSPWWCLVFFLPVVNYGLMLWLAARPSSPAVNWDDSPVPIVVTERLRSAAAGIGASVGIGLAAVVISAFAIESYGLALGAIVALLGGAIGRGVAVRFRGPASGAAYCLVLLPLAAGVDHAGPAPRVREAVTAIEIDAPPAAVWEKVVEFREIAAPPSILFRFGIAYPVRARISGKGVGAVRHCEFSTGAFVEPITVWDEPHRLSFAVIRQPPVLEEWSPYGRVYAPHIDGFFRSYRGEFRLVPLPGARTRLEGSTWYSQQLAPAFYWGPITGMLLARIHTRVLEQVKREAESSAVRSTGRAESPEAGARR